MSSKRVARPASLELATPCLEGTQYKTLSAASGVAYEEARHLSCPWTGPKLDWNFWGEPLGWRGCGCSVFLRLCHPDI